ncbi:MAG: ABC transporter permease [Bacteroidaceae bacterium]|nr:ABC transporter permease [Bacteroidaceae bacterium]
MKIFTNFKNAIRNLGNPGQHNVVKIICLGVGLAVGSILIAKAYFEQSYDTFFPKSDRTYIINETVIKDGEFKEFPQTSGAVAPGVKRYVPQVEAATRYTFAAANCACETQDRKTVSGNIALADSCFFDVFYRPILQGNPSDVLSRPNYCMVNRRFAEAIGGNVVGLKLILKDFGHFEVTIGGVYEDIPRNSYLSSINVIMSMSTMGKLRYDGTKNWVGNDRYKSFIRLSPGCTINDIRSQVEKMRKENLPLEELKKAGLEMNYSFTPLTSVHTSDATVKKMIWILSLLAFVLIFSAVMNYLLVVMGNMVRRGKEMAVRKCYGAEGRNIHGIIFMETLVHLILSILLAAVLIFVCKGTIENILDASITALLFNKGSWILVVVCLLILLTGGLIPGWLYSSVPVASAFRGYKETRRRWKLLLLSVQFIAAGFLVSLLFVINKQYSMMINDNPGYSYENLATMNLDGIPIEQRARSITELQKMSSVESVTSADCMLTDFQSGNNIRLPGDDREYMNIADLYSVSDGYLSTMGIKIVQGRNFTEHTDSLREVMVSHSFVDKMKLLAHWDDNVVGRRILITEHSQHNNETFVICGVYQDIRIGSISSQDTRPSIMFYTKRTCNNILIKFHTLTGDVLKEATQKMQRLYPDKVISIVSYHSLITDLYQDSRRFRDSVMIGGLITLLIALIGLIGYTNDEVSRRHKEIAIRKVNGAQVKNILVLFIKDILRIAIPSLVIGGIGALLVARKWQEQFSEKASLSLFLFLGCGLAVLIIILAVVNINCYKVANSNPVKYLKGE